MDKINVGDKVKVTWDGSEFSGERGVVVGEEADVYKIRYKVKIDKGGYTLLYPSDMEKVEEEMDEIKVGDKVKVTWDVNGFFGEKGIVVGEHGNVYRIRFVNGKCTYLFKWKLEKVEEEMEYEVGKPYLWFGGECPLPEGTKVKVRFGNEDFSDIRSYWNRGGHCHYSEELNWRHEFYNSNVVMFEVVEYPKSTRKVEMELTEEEITTIKEILGKVNL